MNTRREIKVPEQPAQIQSLPGPSGLQKPKGTHEERRITVEPTFNTPSGAGVPPMIRGDLGARPMVEGGTSVPEPQEITKSVAT